MLSQEIELMSKSSLLDKTFRIIMKRMVETGVAPHYTEVSAGLGFSVEKGR